MHHWRWARHETAVQGETEPLLRQESRSRIPVSSGHELELG